MKFKTVRTDNQESQGFVTFNEHEARTATAIFERLFPADQSGPGATEIGVTNYVDKALAGPYGDQLEIYRAGLSGLNSGAKEQYGTDFAACTLHQQDALLTELERGAVHDSPRTFFELLRSHLQEGLFSDPAYGGNRQKLGWKTLGHPGVWLENSAEENLTAEPVTKGGIIQSLADLDLSQFRTKQEPIVRPRFSSSTEVDIILVGLGAMGGIVAPVFAKAGLKVVALEPGPWRTGADYLPDELGATYYCRANMGPKFMSEVPRWRRNVGEPTTEATFSLGRMMNSVGGSVIHYGAWLRRFHPHHFKTRTRIQEKWGKSNVESTVADWPIRYEDLEPYYTLLEQYIGVAGDETNPFIKRSQPLPLPATRPFRLGEFFSKATRELGLYPHPVAVGLTTAPFKGRPATTYCAWNNGFGSFAGDKWDPSLSSVPEALATGNLDLRTRCRVIRLCTDPSGRVNGVEYVDADGVSHVQRGRTVILSAYTFENIRLMFLSGDSKHPNGLGNNTGQLGKHFMTKMFAHVNGYFPNTIFNRHTGPAAQGVVIDDFLADQFDSMQHGFIGGATLGAEQQFLPIQISREAIPSDVRRWGQPYKDHIRNWQHYGVIRIQPDTLSYTNNFIDLDPVYRDRSGLGMPVIRVTYDMRENEHRLAEWMESKAEEILRAMGAVKTWRGQRFTGVGSSHELGGARMGNDPGSSVVSPELAVHDTPSLYVFSGATLPTCPGINPTLSLWAVCYRAAERLVERIQKGEER